MVVKDLPVSLDETRDALAREWDAKQPTTPEQITDFYRHARGLGDDLDAWHELPARQLWTDMLVHVASDSDAKIIVDIGCGAGHDLRAVHDALPNTCMHGVEPNHGLWDRISDIAGVWDDVEEAPIEYADLLICVDVLEHIPDPEAWLGHIAKRAKPDCLLFETTATFDCDTPLHLAANRGWHPGRVLERNGWIVVDAAERVRVWKRVAAVGAESSALLLCAYRGVSTTSLSAIMGLIGGAQKHWRVRTKSGDALISRSRSIVVTSWWAETGDDVFLMIDDDIGFKPEDADRAVELCRNGLDIVCGAYPVHNGEYFSLKTLPGGEDVVFGPGHAPVEIEYAATGFMAVHRRVIDALVKTMPLCHSVQPWAYYPLFQPMLVEDEAAGGWAMLSEDWGFSHIARQAGFKVWLDPQTILSHGSDISINVFNMGAIHSAINL